MILLTLMSSTAYLSVAFQGRSSLFLTTAVEGFINGAQSAFLDELVVTIFGENMRSMVLAGTQISYTVGSGISSMMIATLYDKAAKQQLSKLPMVGNLNQCIGKNCYSLSFTLLGVFKSLSLVPLIKLWNSIG